MRKALILLAVIFIDTTTHAQFKTTFKSDQDTAAEAEIKRLEYALTDLLTSGDIATYSGYLTDDYIRISANGEISTKGQVLQSFSKNFSTGDNTKMYPHDMKVSVYGNTAILHAVLDIETGTANGTIKRTSLITKVFIKRNGRWYLASLQGTPIK